ncbi:hypothetical protein ABS767_06015 [Sphingomonas sp. ST-64]|uniref:Uncharacterized protein n=1 Tax=Sphingomonas plantiphila TaxID=3163295 RepID=A0ABW8YKJ5_9SPHN
MADLHRVDAQVRVTCRGCKATEVWDLDALIAEVRRNGGSMDWRASRAALKCPSHCAAPMIDLLPIPFGKQRARRRAHRHALVNLALQILRDAAHRSSNEAVGTIEVRLALHVLRPFVGDSRLLVEFWKAATIQPRHPWTSCHLPYRWIAERLIDCGEPVDDANRP